MTKHRRLDECSTQMRGSADASVADLTRHLACSAGCVPACVSQVTHVRVVRVAGYRAGRAVPPVAPWSACSPVPGWLRRCRSTHACRFFSHSRWEADRIGLLLARLIVDRLLDADAAIVVVVDDTLFRRWGRKVFGALWTHDGSAQDPNALGRGNRWIGGSVSSSGCRSAGTRCACRCCSGCGAARVPPPRSSWRESWFLLWPRSFRIDVSTSSVTPPTTARPCWSSTPASPPGCRSTPRCTRPRRRAPGTRGRPRLKGRRLGAPADLAATARWRAGAGRPIRPRRDLEIAQTPGIWYGAFGNTPGRTVLVPDPGGAEGCWRSSTDAGSDARRWWPATPTGGRSRSPSPAANNCSASAKPATGLAESGGTHLPLSFCVYTLVIVWYALHGHHPDEGICRTSRDPSPGNPHKDEPAFEDMLAKLRRTLVASELWGVAATQPNPRKYRDYELACAAAAA